MFKPIHAQKAQAVDQLALMLKTAQSFLIYEYFGLTAKELTNLRAKLRLAGCRLTVYQNNILNRAMIQSGIIPEANFRGPNALVLGGEDISPLKDIAKMAKDKPLIKLKAALVEQNLILGKELTHFANLATRNDLYAMIARCLQSPLQKLMLMLQKIAQSKE